MLKRQLLLWLLLMPLYMWGVTITENTTLDRDMVYNEDVIIDGAVLNLNYHTLTINGDLNITGNYGRIRMVESLDKLIVKGDLTFAGASTEGYLTNGVIELSGNFYQKGTNGRSYSLYENRNNYIASFYSTDKHKVVLNGTSQQIVDFESPNSSQFNHIEIKNSSEDGVLFEQLNVVGEWKRNGNHVTIADIRNLTLTEDYTIPNDIKVVGGILNLNGYILTINGNLEVNSNYGRIKMIKGDDKLIVKGDLTFAGASTEGYLTNGVIELSGNFYQKGTNGRSYSLYENRNNYIASFFPTQNHKVILNGNSLQRVSFEAPNSSRFANLEISNDNIIFDLEAGKKVSVIDGLYIDEGLYNSTYKDNEYITFGRYRDIHKTYMTLPRGLQLVALPIASSINESQIASIFSDENISHVLKYDSNSKKWQGFGNSETARKKIADHNVAKLTNIRAGEGFFVKTEGEVELQFPRVNGYGIEKMGIASLSSGWHLVGSNKAIQIDSLLERNSDIKVIREYQDGEDVYWSNDEDIQEEYRRRDIKKFEENNASNSGFWLYVD